MKIYKNQLIIFDIGGITIQLNYGGEGGFFEEASRIAGISQKNFQDWYGSLEKDCLLGKVDAKEHYNMLRKKLKIDTPQKELENLVGLLWKGQIDSTIELKKRIHDCGYNIGILSSMTEFALDILLRRHPQAFEVWGGPKIYSFEKGVIKPDLEISKLLEGEKEKIFIDDNLTYVKTPVEKLGWKAIHYTAFIDSTGAIRNLQKYQETIESHPNLKVANSPEELENALREFGVVI